MLIIGTQLFFMYRPGCPNSPKTEIPYHQKPLNAERVGVELLWSKCTVFPNLGTENTLRWRINLPLCATCLYTLNWNWKNCAFATK